MTKSGKNAAIFSLPVQCMRDVFLGHNSYMNVCIINDSFLFTFLMKTCHVHLLSSQSITAGVHFPEDNLRSPSS